MISAIQAKIIDWIADEVLKLFTLVFKFISPIKISPKVITKNSADDWSEIRTLRIQNKLNSELFDIYIEGHSKANFDITMISSDAPIGKTVEHMDINTNQIAVQAIDERTGNHVWIFRVHKLSAKEELNLRIKVSNKDSIHFKILQHSSIEIPVRENKKGVVEIPFKIKKYEKISVKK